MGFIPVSSLAAGTSIAIFTPHSQTHVSSQWNGIETKGGQQPLPDLRLHDKGQGDKSLHPQPTQPADVATVSQARLEFEWRLQPAARRWGRKRTHCVMT